MRKHSRESAIRFLNASKLKSAHQYYLCLLQLYMPWRQESNLKHEDRIYEIKYKEVENEIVGNIKKHEPYYVLIMKN